MARRGGREVERTGRCGKEGEIRTTESQFWVFGLDAKEVKSRIDIAHRVRWWQAVGKSYLAAPS